MECRVKQVDTAIYALCIALFKIYLIPQSIQQFMKIILLLYVACFVINHIPKKFFINLALLLGAEIVFSGTFSYLSGNTGFYSIYNGLLYAICLFLTFGLATYCSKINYFKEMVNCLYRVVSILCIISLVSMCMKGHSKNGTEIIYFFGYKFITSYYFIFWAVLFKVKYEVEIRQSKALKLVYFLIICVVMFICRWLYCYTAFLASLFLLFDLFVSKRIKKYIMNGKTVLISILLAGGFPFVIKAILNNQYIQYIVKNILHKSMNLTGRVRIFENLPAIIGKRFLMGYGYGNTAVEKVVGYGNAQNGLMQWFVNYGIIGTILFLILVYYCLRYSCFYKHLSGLYIILYVLIICATVEISYNYVFFLTLFVIGAFSRKPHSLDFELNNYIR